MGWCDWLLHGGLPSAAPLAASLLALLDGLHSRATKMAIGERPTPKRGHWHPAKANSLRDHQRPTSRDGKEDQSGANDHSVAPEQRRACQANRQRLEKRVAQVA